MTEILHHLGRLRGEIALADDPPFLVDRDLARDVDGSPTRGGDDVRIGGIVVKAAGAEMIDLGHVAGSRSLSLEA